MSENKEMQQKLQYVYHEFNEIIVNDPKIVKLLSGLKGSENAKKNIVHILTLLALKQFFENSDQEDFKYIYSKVQQDLEKISEKHSEIFQKIKNIASQCYKGWEDKFIEKATKEAEKLETESKRSGSSDDKIKKVTKIINVICSCFDKFISKEQDFDDLLSEYDKDIQEKIHKAIVFCFTTHLFQNVLRGLTANDWKPILLGYELVCFDAMYTSLEKLKDEIASSVKDIDQLEKDINNLYLVFGRRYEKQVYKLLTEK